jgi:glycosyltransferase involved in cell wall biosynthesis
MASGKAILVSDKVGAAADLVEPGKNGGIFKADDSADLAAKLFELISNGKIALAVMGEYSRIMIAKWTIAEQVNVIETAVNNG